MLSPNQETLNQVRKLGRSEDNFELLYTLTKRLSDDTDPSEVQLQVSSILEEGKTYRTHQTKQNFGTFYRAIVGFLLAQEERT